MIATTREKLYSSELLALATSLANWPLVEALPLRGQARSRTCGSAIEVGLVVDGLGKIERIGMRVSACAVGQASAAIFARSASGNGLVEISAARDSVLAWLGGEGPPPDWPGIEALEAAQSFTSRHGAILLPWNAACEALSNAVLHR